MWQGPSPPADLFNKGLRFVQAIDAVTPNSDTAFGYACDLLHHKEDHLTLLHLADLSVRESQEAAAALQAHFSTRLVSRLSAKRYEVKVLDHRPTVPPTPIRGAVLEAINAQAADVCVLGYSALKKGPTMLMGSSKDISLREGHTSSLIIKSWNASQGGAEQVILCGLDGSVRSQQALLLALRLARPGRDTVRALYVEDVASGGVAGEREGDAIEQGALALLAPALASGADVGLLRRPISSLPNPGAVLRAVADELGATVLVIGADGIGRTLREREEGLGSTSDHVLRHATCNVLIFHVPGHIQGILENSNSPTASRPVAAPAGGSAGGGGGGAAQQQPALAGESPPAAAAALPVALPAAAKSKVEVKDNPPLS